MLSIVHVLVAVYTCFYFYCTLCTIKYYNIIIILLFALRVLQRRAVTVFGLSLQVKMKVRMKTLRGVEKQLTKSREETWIWSRAKMKVRMKTLR